MMSDKAHDARQKSNKGDVQTLYRSVSRMECGSTRFVLRTMVWTTRSRYDDEIMSSLGEPGVAASEDEGEEEEGEETRPESW